jgi:hypothetical protein
MNMLKPEPTMISPMPVAHSEGQEIRAPEDLEYQGSFVASAIRCHKLGWRLAAVDARQLVDLEVNFEEPTERWLQQCNQAGPLQGRVNLGVRTGSASGLLVLEVENGEGKSALDQYGSWRSSCRASMNGREQHYYTLPPGTVSFPTKFLEDAQIMLYGEEGLAPLPPSLDVQSQNSWHWINPPWESPPPELPLSLWDLLRQASAPEPASTPDIEPVIPSWEEIYPLIASHEPLLKALLAPFGTLEDHYEGLLNAALEAGFHDQEFLLGLLWHTPQGDVLGNPERGSQLRRMVSEAGSRFVSTPKFNGSLISLKHKDPEQGVLVSRSRYEVILGELRRLKQKSAELEAVLMDWGQTLAAGQPPAPAAPGAATQIAGDYSARPADGGLGTGKLFSVVYESMGKGEQNLATSNSHTPVNENCSTLNCHYSEVNLKENAKPQGALSPESVEATVIACLQNNPDLAGDPAKLQMVQYCFKNYVNIDPDLSDLSLPERLERASQMAREFLKN